MVALPLFLGQGTAYADPAGGAADAVAKKVDTQVLSELSTQGTADFWLRFGDDADLDAAHAAKTKEAKGAAVYEAKTEYADRTQKQARELLAEQGVSYQSFWIVNTIKVTGDAALVEDLAVLDGVESIKADAEIQLDEPTAGTDEAAVNAVEWNITNINAPQVWDQYGVHGEGIVVANIDSGVDYLHPAVNSKYRGKNADGTYSNDYNWFDPTGVCPTAGVPCDNNGHGTHTMGTMVGGDGANTIGVAPGAKWIAAKGCATSSCPEAALLAAGQWIVAPTDANGDNPDPSKAPHVVNNSWGGGTSDDPWYEEIVQSWEDAGIFPSWSNGNDGELGCNSSGDPGVYPVSYSSGAYDINNAIADFSGRGPGRDGEVKPNLAAPGVNVRSSVPNGGYQAFSGTSMAAPHTTAVVALMWSAAPALVGDVAATKALLDGTARDTENLECGGTLANNNVFGEGRLDALAAVEASPRGGTGALNGTVTGDGAPLAGATVVIDGPMDRTLTTGADGKFAVAVASVGDYTVTASKFGYGTDSATGTVTEGQTTTVDLALEAVPSGDVEGVVTDGGGQGWPLYAKVTVTGTDMFTYTDPATGEFALTLPSSQHTLHVESVIPGYTAADVPVDASTGASADVALIPGADCTTPGYELDYGNLALAERFTSTSAPAGWTVVNNSTKGGLPWVFNDPGARKNLTGGDGGFAIGDSDESGSGKDVDTDLISPAFDLSASATKVLTFNSDLNMLTGDVASVSVTTDDGATWTKLWEYTNGQDRRGPRVESIDLATIGTATAVKVKFHYAGTYDWWWQVDNVQIGTPDCVAVDGGLVVGNVLDQNAGTTLNGAKVTDTVSGATATTAATPDDTQLADGFYWLFTEATGSHDLTASKGGYQSHTKAVDVANHGTTEADFTLGAGRIVVDKTQLDSVVTLGAAWTHDLKFTNTGTAPATIEIGENGGDWTASSTGAPFTVLNPDQKADLSAKPAQAPVKPESVPSVTADDAWAAIANYPVAVFDATASYGDGALYVVGGTIGADQTGKGYKYADGAWTAIADMPTPRNQPQSEFIGGKLYVTGGWLASGAPATEVEVYDPSTNSWSTGADNGTGRAAAGHASVDGDLYLVGGCADDQCAMSNDVVSYDAGSDSWSTHADYPLATAFLSCGGLDGTLVCAGGFDDQSPTTDAYAYDPSADAWTALPAIPVSLAGSAYSAANGKLVISGGWVNGAGTTNATVAFDKASGAWETLPNNTAPRARTTGACGFFKVGGWQTAWTGTNSAETLGGLDDCGGSADVPWLKENPQTVTVNPGQTVTVKVTTSAKAADGVDQPGTYTAGLSVKTGTPYGTIAVGVQMLVAPTANLGKLIGTISGKNCDGSTSPIVGAQVQVKNVSTGVRTDLKTDAKGNYAWWLKAAKYQVIVSKDGWAADVSVFTVKKQQINELSFTLDKIGCTATKVDGGWLIPLI
ncbi:S8 family serine peptidase [Phytomonospora sp. NPDC050363]|uniref:S8 family serine peptidase n=1 Tax=Phytomonospora sp. NPDC050363 TaxID=3155642 RepID=UPI0033D7A2D3